MLTAVRGYYEKGRIFLEERAPVENKADVIVTFLSENTNDKKQSAYRQPGALKGKVNIPDNFNDPMRVPFLSAKSFNSGDMMV
jgi:hypothetical protein